MTNPYFDSQLSHDITTVTFQLHDTPFIDWRAYCGVKISAQNNVRQPDYFRTILHVSGQFYFCPDIVSGKLRILQDCWRAALQRQCITLSSLLMVCGQPQATGWLPQ